MKFTIWSWLRGARRVRWWAGALVGCWVLGQSAQAQVAAAPVHVSTLSNGMTLIVQVDRRAPTAVHMVWVRVGSMDEVDGLSGVAHVLEHMLFKGTPTLAEGEFSRRVAALGGRDNAFTSRDATAYHQQIPAQHLPDVMRLEADRLANNVWADDAFAREMGVIKEERRQRVEESAQARMFEMFQASAWVAHPYRRPIIGWMSDLQAMTADDVRRFYRQWYVPANAAVVVVGDVDVAQVQAWAQQFYGSIPAGAVPVRKPHIEPAQTGVRRIEYRGRTDRPLLVLGYRAPALRHPEATDEASTDALALLLLAGVLDGHDAARLSRALVQGQPNGKRRWADSVGAWFSLEGRGPPLFWITASPAAGVEPSALERAIQAEVARIARDGVTEAELRRVKNQWAASEVFKRDSMFAQARELGSYWIVGWPSDAAQTLQRRLQHITPQQVQSVAARYFKPNQLTVGVLLPEERQP